ncbi:hypothetical protein BDR06DRAFT_969448 [Suillus hirtellus]|nr:hypothetical protein BDR06DRAFT_969448 [Suillus hirtellus]
MSLDLLDDIYLGPDDELDSDSGSSSSLDVLNVIPDPPSPALADGLALYNDLDLYLGPEDTLISSDDAPVVPDFPMAVNESTPEPHLATLVVPEAPIPSLRAMVQEFMPIGSYDQAENHLGDYQQRHGNLPAPTVAKILEADRPFRMAWAETCNKLRKADANFWRIQRVRESTSKMLKVLDILIEAFEDSNILQYYSVFCAQYLGLSSWGSVVSAWYSGLGSWGSVLGVRYLGLGTRDLAFGIYNLVVGVLSTGICNLLWVIEGTTIQMNLAAIQP